MASGKQSRQPRPSQHRLSWKRQLSLAEAIAWPKPPTQKRTPWDRNVATCHSQLQDPRSRSVLCAAANKAKTRQCFLSPSRSSSGIIVSLIRAHRGMPSRHWTHSTANSLLSTSHRASKTLSVMLAFWIVLLWRKDRNERDRLPARSSAAASATGCGRRVRVVPIASTLRWSLRASRASFWRFKTRWTIQRWRMMEKKRQLAIMMGSVARTKRHSCRTGRSAEVVKPHWLLLCSSNGHLWASARRSFPSTGRLQ